MKNNKNEVFNLTDKKEKEQTSNYNHESENDKEKILIDKIKSTNIVKSSVNYKTSNDINDNKKKNKELSNIKYNYESEKNKDNKNKNISTSNGKKNKLSNSDNIDIENKDLKNNINDDIENKFDKEKNIINQINKKNNLNDNSEKKEENINNKENINDNVSEDNGIHGQKKHTILNSNNGFSEEEKNSSYRNKKNINNNENIMNKNNKEDIQNTSIRNKFIYAKQQKNIFYVDENDDSEKEDHIERKNTKSRVNKNEVNVNFIKDNFEKNEIMYVKVNKSYSENEELENSEIETSSIEEEEEDDDEEEYEENNDIEIKNEKEVYLLELEDNGLPNLQNDEIISCNINSLINISVYNGLLISKDICLITNCENEFPSPFYLETIIKELTEKSQKVTISPRNLTNQKYTVNSNGNINILKSLKKYKIYPCKINTKIYFKVSCKVAGNISFCFIYKDSTQNNIFKFTKPFHILVNPLIDLNNNTNFRNKLLDVNQIQMQSIIPKSIGNLSIDFEKYFEEASLLEFNFIHFHSFQQLSTNDNIYIFKDHHELNETLFNTNTANNNTNLETNQKYQLLFNSIKNLKNKYNIGSITDVILSQTSSESEWIYKNKDCTYNLKNTPWLNVSYELDKILMKYSKLFSAKKVSYKLAPYIYNINNINQIISEITDYINEGNLQEFFMISEEKYIQKFKAFYKNIKNEEFNKNYIMKKNILLTEITKAFEVDREDKINEILTNINYMINLVSQSCINYGYERFGVKMCVEFVSILVIESYKEKNHIKKFPSENNFIKDIKYYISILNQRWIKEIKELLKISIFNIKEYLRYKYLQLNNRKKIDQLIESYFIVKNENDQSEIYLSNGWIMNSDDPNSVFPNIVKYGSWYHLKRKVIIFKDTIKINYGLKIEDTSLNLLDYMTKYISTLSSIFDGLFIDPISYIPISVLKYLIYAAKKVNPSIILLCNISSNCKKKDNNIALLKKKYVEELGINLFVDELIWNNNTSEIINSIINNGSSCNSNIYTEIISHFNKNLYSSSFIDENKIIFGKFKYLKPKKPFNIIYDLYNSLTYFEKFNKLSLNIPILSIIGLLDTSIGSTYGFDQLYPFLPNIENEKRKYNIDNNEIKNLIKKTMNNKLNSDETFEVFFEYHPNEKQPQVYNNYIYSVHLALNIFDFNPDIELTKIKNNLYMTKIRLPPGKYYYQYVINNNIWTYDNTQPIEEDDNSVKYNVIDLRNQNKIIIPDIKLYRKELNKIRNYFKSKQSEIYIQKNQDMYGIIRLITESKSLVNNNIEEKKVLKYKNKLTYSTDENFNYETDEDEDEINNKMYKSPEIKKTTNNSQNDNLAKSFQCNSNLEDSLLFNENKKLVNSININEKKHEMSIDSIKNKILNGNKDNNLLEASMEVNLNRSSHNLDINNNTNMDIYDGYAIICFPSLDNKNMSGKGEIIIPGKISELICACYFNDEKININYILRDNNLNGARNEIYFTKDIKYLKCISNIKYSDDKTIINFYNAPPNLGLIIKFVIGDKKSINNLNENLEILFNKGNEFINHFDIFDINHLLFKTEIEEKNNTNKKKGIYEIKINLFNELKENTNKTKELKKKKIKFIYAGINQLVELIKVIKRTENQNLFYNTKKSEIFDLTKNNENFTNANEDKKIIIQSLYKDIYNSDNYINYIIERFSGAKSFQLMYNFIKKIILPQYELLPSFIKPVYFEKIVISIYQNIIRASLGKIPSYILNFGDFAIGLSLCRYEFIKKNIISSFNNKLIKKYDTNQKLNENQNMNDLHISSGLPLNDKNSKISTRDILISFNSLFLIPKLFYEAKVILKLIGSTMKYGLIPDKIDNSNNIKYSSRDTCWYYIKAIKDYIYSTMDYKFLKEQVYLLYLPENVNNSYFKQKTKKCKKVFTVENIIQFIFQYHAQGINFIDKKTEQQPYQRRPIFKKNIDNTVLNGLKINIYLDIETGFIYGGNKLNSGTWMNHIGSSIKAKNINIPATPRDGADIEIIALLYNCLNFVIDLNYKNYYSYKNVILSNNEVYTFYQWSLVIKKNFEKKFFVKKIFSHFQNKINIYKDYIIKPNNTNNIKITDENEKVNDNKEIEEEKEEFKLRPNILLAIYYAPDLFITENIIKVLENIEKYLLRPEIINENLNGMIGIKTLDKTDIDYIGKLDLKETSNYKTSCGFNIHNGVEFVWLYGIYLMIKIKYKFNFNYDYIENDSKDSFIPKQTDEMVRYVSKKLIPFIKYMKENKYMGVPEIIDEIGNVSNEGNQSDLKSMATFFELINKLAWVNDKINNNNDSEDEISSIVDE